MTDRTPRLGDYFSSRREKGLRGLPTLSVTLDRGLVRRDTLDRRTDTTLEPEEHLLVRKGDIAYNMMRMWQGASGLAEEDAIVSPAYVVLTPRNHVDPSFAAALFKLPEMVHRFWAYSYGLTEDRLRLYFNDFKRIPWVLPPLTEQKKIADILSTWDKAIETTEKLVANAQEQKRALMVELLTGKRRLKGFDEDWGVRSLDAVATIRKGKQKSKITLLDEGEFPVINGGIVPSGYTNEWNSEAGTITISEGGNSCGFVNFLAERFWSGGHCYTLENLDIRRDFLFHWLKFKEPEIMKLRVGSGLPNIQKKAISAVSVAIPTVREQQHIEEILNDADAVMTAISDDLEMLRAEKQALMQQLLTGKRRVSV